MFCGLTKLYVERMDCNFLLKVLERTIRLKRLNSGG